MKIPKHIVLFSLCLLMLARPAQADSPTAQKLRDLYQSDQVKRYAQEQQPYEALRLLEKTPPAEVAAAAAKLAEADPNFRAQGIRLLTACRAPEHVPQILGYLSNKDEKSDVRAAAIWALSRIYREDDKRRRDEMAGFFCSYANDPKETSSLRGTATRYLIDLVGVEGASEYMLNIAQTEYTRKEPDFSLFTAMRNAVGEPGYTYHEPEKKIRFLMDLMKLQAEKGGSPLSWKAQRELQYDADALSEFLKIRPRLSDETVKALETMLKSMTKLAFDHDEATLRRYGGAHASFQSAIEKANYDFNRLRLTRPIRKGGGDH